MTETVKVERRDGKQIIFSELELAVGIGALMHAALKAFREEDSETFEKYLAGVCEDENGEWQPVPVSMIEWLIKTIDTFPWETTGVFYVPEEK